MIAVSSSFIGGLLRRRSRHPRICDGEDLKFSWRLDRVGVSIHWQRGGKEFHSPFVGFDCDVRLGRVGLEQLHKRFMRYHTRALSEHQRFNAGRGTVRFHKHPRGAGGQTHIRITPSGSWHLFADEFQHLDHL